MSTPPRDMREWMRAVERKLSQAIRSGNATTIKEAQAELNKVKSEILAQVSSNEIPTAPIEFVVQTALYVDWDKRQRGNFYVSFPAVTLSTTAEPIEISHYELWGREETGKTAAELEKIPLEVIQSSSTPQFTHTNLDPGSNWRYRIRAIPKSSPVPGVFGADIVVTIAVDTTPPPVPTAPVVTSRLGMIIVEWDGLTSTGVAQPPDYAFTEIAFGATTSPETLVPQVFQGSGITTLSKVEYGPYHVRLRSVDTSGNRSAWSANVTGELTPLVTGDISGLDTTFQQQVARIEQAEADALAATNAATTAQNTATTAQGAATAAQQAADAAQADATALQTRATELQAAADAAQATADQAALDAAAAQQAATQANTDAQARMDTLQGELDSMMGTSAQIIRQELAPAAEYQRSGVLWIKDSTGESFTWDAINLVWKLVDNATIAQLAADADAAADAAAAAELAAQTAQTNASNAQTAATGAQTAASTSASEASASATAANQAQANADAAALAAQQSADAASASQAAADQAAQDAGASSAEALLAREAAEDAQVAADLARVQAETQVEAIRLQGHNLVFDGGFETTSNWPASAGSSIVTTQAHTGLQSMRLAPTAGNAWPVSKWIDINATNHTFRVGGWWKRESGTESLTNSVGYVVQVKTQAGGTASHVGTWAPNVQTIPDSDWVYIYVDIKTPTANIVGARFAPWAKQSANVYLVDNIEAYDISEAASALEAAQAAADDASAAHGRADSAYTNAQNALNAVSHNAKNLFSTSPPAGSAPLGTIWVQTDADGKALSSWQQTAGTEPAADGTGGTLGSTWTPRPIRSEMIENLDVAKLVGQFIDSSHIQTESLTVSGGGTLGGKLTAMEGETSSVADKVTNVTDASGNLLASKVSGTLSAGNIPALEFSQVNGLTNLDNTLNAIKARQESWQASDVTFIDGGKLYNDSVTTLQLAANAVTAEIIAAGAISAGHLSAVNIWADNAWLTALESSSARFRSLVGDTEVIINSSGLQIIETDADQVPRTLVNLGPNEDKLVEIENLSGGSDVVIDQAGNVSSQAVNASTFTLNGANLLGTLDGHVWPGETEGAIEDSILGNMPRGIVARHYRDTLAGSSWDYKEVGFMEVAFDLIPYRTYMIVVQPIPIVSKGNNVTLRLRWTTDGTRPEVTKSNIWRQITVRGSATNTTVEVGGTFFLHSGGTPQEARILLCIADPGGITFNGAASLVDMAVVDVGIASGLTGENRGSYGDPVGGGTAPTPPAETASVKSYTSTWAANWFKSYSLSGSTHGGKQYAGSGSAASNPIQGYTSYWAGGGRQTSQWGVSSTATASNGETSKTITSALSGATITKVEVYMKAEHWHSSSGGTARIHYHGNSSAPATYADSPANFIGDYSFGRGQGRWITLSAATYGSLLKSGEFRGIGLAPRGSTSTAYYGYLSWADKPKIRVSYKR